MQMQEHNFVIAPRFCGPPASANGGYVAGRLAEFVGPAAEVTLRRPPPLATKLRISVNGEEASLLHGDVLLAEARPAQPDVQFHPAVSPTAAAAAAGRTFDSTLHRIPGCFVCGPGRAPGDGLRLHVGPVDEHDEDWAGVLAAPWIPADDLANDAGTVRNEFVWAALDCPTAYACGSPAGMPPVLLGRQAVAITRAPLAGESCVVAARQCGQDGRKYFAEAALIAADGERMAVCTATWIQVSEEVLAGIG